MSFPPFLFSSTGLELSDLFASNETLIVGAIISAGVVVYSVSKLGDIKTILGYLVILLSICLIILIIPSFQGQPARQYAEEILVVVLELVKGIGNYIREHSTAQVIGGIIQ